VVVQLVLGNCTSNQAKHTTHEPAVSPQRLQDKGSNPARGACFSPLTLFALEVGLHVRADVREQLDDQRRRVEPADLELCEGRKDANSEHETGH
jgi:hypothetical protein